LLNLRWCIPATDDPMIDDLLRQVVQYAREQSLPVLPSVHPLVVHRKFEISRQGGLPWKVEDVVLMRTATNLLAVDLLTGKRLWRVDVDDPLEAIGSASSPAGPQTPSPQQASQMAYRLWDDATYGMLSSDGRYVYSVEDLPWGPAVGQSTRRVILPGGTQNPEARPPLNRLTAHDVRTGKLKWHLGGADDQFALRQAETFFLGPPLPLMGRVYVLAEKGGEVRLMVLDAVSGDLLWKQQLACVESEFGLWQVNRTAGVSPSYADGILVCPTGVGATVAVDLATRSLLWGYRHAEKEPLNPYLARARLMQLRASGMSGNVPYDRFCDASVTIADGRVLLTPPSADELHCLDLLTGKPCWRLKRSDDLYVACVHEGKVVLVGRSGLRAVSLTATVESKETVQQIEQTERGMESKTVEVRVTRPKPAWDGRTVEFAEGATPSGRGFYGGPLYFVPLSTAEVVAVDVAEGRVVRQAKSRKGLVPGNLICYRGRVISQGFRGVETFYQIETAREEIDRRLGANPDDPLALSLRGETLLDEGDRAGAIARFRRAYEIDSDPRTRVLLREALLEALREQFAEYRDRGPEVEALLDTPSQRAEYLRLMACGLQAAGQWRPALEEYLKLIDLDEDRHELDEVSPGLSVRRDRWIRAQLAALREEAGAEGAEALEEPVAKRLQAALAAGDVQSLRGFLALFGDHLSAGAARQALIDRLRQRGRLLEAELELWNAQESEDREVAARATAELAALLVEAKRPGDAAWCYRRLGREFAAVVCRDGKTGRELYEGVANEGPVAEALAPEPDWPQGKVVVEAGQPSRVNHSSYGRYTLPMREGTAPFFGDVSLQLDQSRRGVRALDGYGHRVWELSLQQSGVTRAISFHPTLSHGRACGHLLLAASGHQNHQLVAVDTLGNGEEGQPKLLWTENLRDPGFDLLQLQRVAAQRGVPFNPFGVPFGMVRTHSAQQASGGLGPVTSQYVCFQRFRKLTAADPASGEPLWVRNHVAVGSFLFGDDEYVFALAPDEAEADVFGALDGSRLGRRAVPRIEQPGTDPGSGEASQYAPFSQQCLATFGRRLLLWRQEDSAQVLEMFDPWTQERPWPARRLPAGTHRALIGQEALALLEPNGRFWLISLPDGRAISDVQLEVGDRVAEIFAFRSGEQHFLVTHSPTAGTQRVLVPVQPVPGTISRPITHGRVFAFDLEGNLAWPKPVTIRNQHLLPDQPARLPVLTFACQVYNREANGINRHQVAVLCLDKRTGREVHKEEYPGNTSVFDITGDPEAHTMRIRTMRNTITLKFTDEEPEPPPTASRALLKALRRAAVEAAEDPASPQPTPPPKEPTIEPPRIDPPKIPPPALE
jgi:outer membrane protein assembly factor BamB